MKKAPTRPTADEQAAQLAELGVTPMLAKAILSAVLQSEKQRAGLALLLGEALELPGVGPDKLEIGDILDPLQEAHNEALTKATKLESDAWFGGALAAVAHCYRLYRKPALTKTERKIAKDTLILECVPQAEEIVRAKLRAAGSDAEPAVSDVNNEICRILDHKLGGEMTERTSKLQAIRRARSKG